LMCINVGWIEERNPTYCQIMHNNKIKLVL
jgi:hypothetical protein